MCMCISQTKQTDRHAYEDANSPHFGSMAQTKWWQVNDMSTIIHKLHAAELIKNELIINHNLQNKTARKIK